MLYSIADTFNLYFIEKTTNELVKLNMSKENLAWNTDRDFKFSNPPDRSFSDIKKS